MENRLLSFPAQFPALVLCSLALAGCDTPVAPEDAAPASVVFASDGDIFRIALDGTGLRNLTNQTAQYRSMHLSPGGDRVTFHSDRSGCYEVWVMDVDGSDLTQLTGVSENQRCSLNPRWSPDGTRIAFYSSRDVDAGLGWETYVMNADGSGVVNVGANPSTDPATYEDLAHGWSPDGRVVVHSNRSGAWATYLAEPDGSGAELLLDSFGEPRWSPDGSRLVFGTGFDHDRELWLAAGDASGATRIDVGEGIPGLPRGGASLWSPDGSHFAFHVLEAGTNMIYVVRADGTGLRAVTDDRGSARFLHWSPDGSAILFALDGQLHTAAVDQLLLTPVPTEPGPIGPAMEAAWVPRH